MSRVVAALPGAAAPDRAAARPAISGAADRPGSAAIVRVVTLAVLALLAAVPLAPLGGKGVDVVVVADLSRSMPADSRARALEIVKLLEQRRATGDRVGIVTFGREARIERLPEEFGEAARFRAGGRSRRQRSRRRDRSGRQPDPARAAGPPDRALRRRGERRAGDGGGARGGRARTADRLPSRSAAARRPTSPSSRSICPAWSTSASRSSSRRRCAPTARSRPRPCCFATSVEVARTTRTFQPGATQLTFRDLIDRPGVARYRLELAASGDRVPENNVGDGAVRVEAPATILLVNAGGASGQSEPRAVGGQAASSRRSRRAAMPRDLAGLLAYRAVILENVPAGQVGPQALAGTGARSPPDLGGGLLADRRQRRRSASAATSSRRSIRICRCRWRSRTSIASCRSRWRWRSIGPAAWRCRPATGARRWISPTSARARRSTRSGRSTRSA